MFFIMPEFLSKEHVIILCDSWYTKKNLVSIIDEYPNLDLIGNARIDSVMYDLAPERTGRRGRPAKHGKRLCVETDFTFPRKRSVIIIQVSAGFSQRSLATEKFLLLSRILKKETAQNVYFSAQSFQKI